MGKPSGVLVPLSPSQREALPEAVRECALGWQAPQPFAPLCLVTPAGLCERELHAGGWRSRGRVEAGALPDCMGCDAEALGVGARVWAPDSAAAIVGAGWPGGGSDERLLAELEPVTRDLLARTLRQRDLIAVGDLLQTSRADSPSARTLARAAALRATSSLGAIQLAGLLRGDAAAGVTPLAQVALGAALWEPWRGPWPPDAALEFALAEQVLRSSEALSADAPPQAAREALQSLQGEVTPPVWVPPIYASVRQALAEPPGAAPLPMPPGGWLGFLLADRASPPEERRARSRRADGASEWARSFPELVPLDGLVERALAGGPWAPVRARLRELEREDPRWAAAELERARATLTDAQERPASADAALLALRSVCGEDVRDAARALLSRGDPETEPLAFAVLDRAGEALAPLNPGDGVALAQLCRFHAWRAQQAGEPPQALVDALVDRVPEGLRLSEAALAADLESVARLLAAALPLDLALDLVQAHAPPALLVHERSDGAWDAILDGAQVVLRALGDLGPLPPACLATPAGMGETPFAVAEHPRLGSVAVCHRVRGLPAGPSARAWRAVVPALRALHEAGFALGADPLLSLRESDAGWSLAGVDLPASLRDPERAQRADEARLLERARAAFSDPPRTLAALEARVAQEAPGAPGSWWAELRDFALDAYADGSPFTVEELCARLDVGADCAGSAREVVLSLDAELWAAVGGQLTRDAAGTLQLVGAAQ